MNDDSFEFSSTWLLTEHATLINIMFCGVFSVGQSKNQEGVIEGWLVWAQTLHGGQMLPITHPVLTREEATASLHTLAAKLPGIDVVDLPSILPNKVGRAEELAGVGFK